MHQPGIEPGSHRWQRCILPLDHWCWCLFQGSFWFPITQTWTIYLISFYKTRVFSTCKIRFFFKSSFMFHTFTSFMFGPPFHSDTFSWHGAPFEKVVVSPTSAQSTPVGFEPTRGDPIGLAGRRLNHSAKVSLSHTRTRVPWVPIGCGPLPNHPPRASFFPAFQLCFDLAVLKVPLSDKDNSSLSSVG